MEYTNSRGTIVIIWIHLMGILRFPMAIAQVHLGQRGCVPCTAATPSETPSVVLWYRGRHETSRELLIVGQSDGRQIKMADRQGLQVDPWTHGLTIRGARKEDKRFFVCMFVPMNTAQHSYMAAAPFTQHAEYPCTASTNVTDIRLVLWFRGSVTMTTMDGDLLYVIDDAGKAHVTSDVRFDMEVDMTSYSLKVGVVLPSDVGFTCVVVSADGLRTSHRKPQPAGNPGTPINLGVRDVTSRTVTLTWQYNGDGGFPPLSAEVDTIFHGQDASWEHAMYEGESCDVISRQCQVTVTGLTPGSEYRFRLCAKNSHEDGARYSDYVEDHDISNTPHLPAVSLLPVRVYPGMLSLIWSRGTPPRNRPSRRRYRRNTPVPSLSLVLEYEIPESNIYSRYPREGKVALEGRGLNITGDFSPYNDYNILLKVYENLNNHPSLLLPAVYIGIGATVNNNSTKTDNNKNNNDNNGNINNTGNNGNGNNNENNNNNNSKNANSTIVSGPVPDVHLQPVIVQKGALTVRWTSNCSRSCAKFNPHLLVIEYEIPNTDIYSRYPANGMLSLEKKEVLIKGDFSPSSDYRVHLLVYQHLHTHPTLTLTTNYTGIVTMSVTNTEVLQMPTPLIIMSSLGAVILVLLISLIITCAKKR